MESVANNTDVLGRFSNQLAGAVERVSSAVVLVNGRERQAASGLVVGKDLVLTAAHVLERDDPQIETHDGKTFTGKVLAHDSVTDLAIIKVEGLGLESAAIAENGAKLGEFVLAVGRPVSGQPMASSGIISAIGGPVRTREGSLLEKYLTTDARPYPGFSGGAVINTAGEVLGVMTSGLLGNTSIAIPAALAWRTADTLAKNGTVKRGYLGIGSQVVELGESQRAGRKQESGLLVIHVEQNGGAHTAGVFLGDIIVGLDGQTVTDSDSLLALLSGDRVGKTVQLDIIRAGELKSLQVTIGERGK
ncbi:MAG: trypsin-like peptidase domain-containing protein [Chloroflexota bacterium]